MRIAKKEILKFLNRETQKLPVQRYKAYHKYFKPHFEMVEGESRLVGGEVEKHLVNHKRRAFRRWKRYGWEGIVRYFANYGFKLNKI